LINEAELKRFLITLLHGLSIQNNDHVERINEDGLRGILEKSFPDCEHIYVTNTNEEICGYKPPQEN
jgi:hypothetical protein